MPPRDSENPSRRAWLSEIAGLFLSTGISRTLPLLSSLSSAAASTPLISFSQAASDLHGIFGGEIAANFHDNVYSTLGNQLQLDGIPYLQVSRALAETDLLGIVEKAELPDDSRQKLIFAQRSRTEDAYVRAVEAVRWPKYAVSVSIGSIETAAPETLQLHAGIRQPILIRLVNRVSTAQTVTLQYTNVQGDPFELKIEPDSSRYLSVFVEPGEAPAWSGAIRFSSATASGELSLKGVVEPTAVLHGILGCAAGDENPPIARVRVTDKDGRYCPPEEQRSGLVRMVPYGNPARAERWLYAENSFRVRVPLGDVRVSIRRGLEYNSTDEVISVRGPREFERRFVLRRWSHMEADGWYPGDMHVHMLDPGTALFEMRAENLCCANVMVFKHLTDTYARDHFSGALDPISDHGHYVYYNEEFRNEPMGHIGLVNLKRIVEPISTGRLGLHWPTVMRFESLNMPLPLHGDDTSPDYPLLVEVMRQAHQQGGYVDWVHLRPSQWEFPLDAAERQIDFADIMTHTELPRDLQLWYALLNCGFEIPACAGTDRIEPTDPIGHQRVYVHPEGALSYENWMHALKQGNSFVTNGPMLRLKVDGADPGKRISIDRETSVGAEVTATSQLPFERLEIIVNGEIVHAAPAIENQRSGKLKFRYPATKSAWLAARCMGKPHPELFYTHPVFAHSNPVYIQYGDDRIEDAGSARYLLSFLRKLENWARAEAHFANASQRAEVLATIEKGIQFFETMAKRP
ncbi:MAG: CehA/McbA family metallohydrolase [Bryobacteraceae bacterium]